MGFHSSCCAMCSGNVADRSNEEGHIITYKHQKTCFVAVSRCSCFRGGGETRLWHPLVWIPKCICLMLFKACLCKSSHLSLNSLSYRNCGARNVKTDLDSTSVPTSPPRPFQNHLAMLKCTLSVTRYKGPCFAPFGGAAVSKALSVKRASPCICNFLCKYVFCLWRGKRFIGKPSMKWKKYDSDGAWVVS